MSTLELMLAFAILMLALTSVVTAVFGNQSVTVDTQLSREALGKAQAMLEDARADSMSDFALVSSTSSLESSGGIFYHKSLSVSQLDLFTKEATATVSYQSGSRTLSVSLSTLLADYRSAQGAGDCGALEGDWTHPKVLNVDPIAIGPDALTGLAVSGGKVYLVGYHSGTQQNFFTVDVSDPAHPRVLASARTGSTGLAAVALAGPYAYVAARSTTGQLQVIDISDPTHPVVVGSKKVVGATGIGNSIFYYRGIVYLGLTASGGGPQLALFEVSSSTNPAAEGTVTLGHDVNAIRVSGSYAYVASPDQEELKVFEVSNPMSPQPAGGSGVLPDTTANGKSLFIAGTTLYLGRTVGLASSTKQLYAFNLQTPALDPLPAAGIPQKVGDSVNSLLVRSTLAFLATDTQLQVWSLLDPNIPVEVASLTFTSKPVALSCAGNMLYVGTAGQSGSDVLSIIGPS